MRIMGRFSRDRSVLVLLVRVCDYNSTKSRVSPISYEH